MTHGSPEPAAPFPVIFRRADRKLRTILVPNLSNAFGRIGTAVFRSMGFKAESLPMADDQAKQLGRRFVHNDICYPAQINIGEALRYLELKKPDPATVALGLAKNCRDCRAGQYSVLARKALDDAGYGTIPIVTTGVDTKAIHPGFNAGMRFPLGLVWGISAIDVLDEMRLKTRPYEKNPGETDRVYDIWLTAVTGGLERGRVLCFAALKKAVPAFNAVAVDRNIRRPKVLVIGEILMNFHETANNRIVRYLESHGMEVVMPRIGDFFRRDMVYFREKLSRNLSPNPLLDRLVNGLTGYFYKRSAAQADTIARSFRYYERHATVFELARKVEGFVDVSFMPGEGWLIPAEIMEQSGRGVNAFIIIQPFGCLPNHVTGKGLIKSLKERLPGAHILTLDYDSDVSAANIENRLQMIVMAAKGLV